MIKLREKRPKNIAEQSFFDMMKANGWNVTKRGWPDFFCFHHKTGRLSLVEIKSKRGHRLKREQFAIMQKLSECGVPCFKWTPNGGFVPIKPTMTPDML